MRSRWINALVVFWCGCIPVGLEAGGQPVTPGTIAQEAREMTDAAAQYSVQEKAAFERKAQEELAAIQRRMTALQAKADKASATARTELQRSIHELEDKKETIGKQLEGLRVATDGAWNELKAGIHEAMEELNQSYERVRSSLP